MNENSLWINDSPSTSYNIFKPKKQNKPSLSFELWEDQDFGMRFCLTQKGLTNALSLKNRVKEITLKLNILLENLS